MIGIDLGTTNSAVSVVDSGFPILLADEQGRRLLPSIVAHHPEDGFLTGHEALTSGLECVHSVKRYMGALPTDHESAQTCSINGQLHLPLGEEKFTPVELSAALLSQLKRTAEFRLKKECTEAIITIPAYFNENQRNATAEAAKLAGLEVKRLIAEPTAAALAYGLERANEKTKVAVFDLGGGTFDISLLEMQKGFFEVLSTNGDTALGGDDFDRIIQNLSAKKGAEISLLEARTIKHELSENDTQHVTQQELKDASWKLLEKMRGLCEKALIDANLTKNDLERIILVGGSTKMPIIREFTETIFEKAPDLCMNPDEAVALGAGIQAGILSGSIRQTVLLDVTPLSLGIETLGGLMNVIIPRNSTIPCKKGELFTNAVEGQKEMKISILQGERELAKDNWKLGELTIPFTPAAKGQARVGIQFELDESGLLTVLARDTETNEDKVLTIERSTVDVTDVAVERMIDESVDHALDDMDARVFTEAKLKADELLSSLNEGLSLCGDQLSLEEKERITLAEKAVTAAIAAEDGAALKKAVEELDDATDELAALIMQQLMGM